MRDIHSYSRDSLWPWVQLVSPFIVSHGPDTIVLRGETFLGKPWCGVFVLGEIVFVESRDMTQSDFLRRKISVQCHGTALSFSDE